MEDATQADQLNMLMEKGPTPQSLRRAHAKSVYNFDVSAGGVARPGPLQKSRPPLSPPGTTSSPRDTHNSTWTNQLEALLWPLDDVRHHALRLRSDQLLDTILYR